VERVSECVTRYRKHDSMRGRGGLRLRLTTLRADIPELTEHAHSRTFIPPITLIGGSLIWKIPKVSASAQEDGGADQFTRADV
jgi:hypothetical protein